MEAIEKLKVSYRNGEIEVVGNRAGLKFLATVCLGLSDLMESEARTAANHVHLADYMNNAEEGSVPMLVTLNPNL